MVTSTATTEAGPAKEIDCRHHWRIEQPAGETSRGVCKLCGATRSFRNSFAPNTRPPRRASTPS